MIFSFDLLEGYQQKKPLKRKFVALGFWHYFVSGWHGCILIEKCLFQFKLLNANTPPQYRELSTSITKIAGELQSDIAKNKSLITDIISSQSFKQRISLFTHKDHTLNIELQENKELYI